MTLFDRQLAGHIPFQKRFEGLADVNTRGPNFDFAGLIK
jgi:hypothetical protein